MIIFFHNFFFKRVLPKTTVSFIPKVLVDLFLVASFLIAVLNFGKIKESTIAKKRQYPRNLRFNRVFEHIFYEPYLYIVMPLTINIYFKKQHAIVIMACFTALSDVLGSTCRLPISGILIDSMRTTNIPFIMHAYKNKGEKDSLKYIPPDSLTNSGDIFW